MCCGFLSINKAKNIDMLLTEKAPVVVLIAQLKVFEQFSKYI